MSQPDILFYHLVDRPLERVLPVLLEKSLARGWRVVVECGSEERCQALDSRLWDYSEESFLPHSATRDGHEADQPIWLTTDRDDSPNGAEVRFLVDGARPRDVSGYQRLVLIFDGRDQDALSAARDDWKRLKNQDQSVTYWQQNERGGWEQKA